MIGNDWDNELKVIWNSPNFNKFYNSILDLYKKVKDLKGFYLKEYDPNESNNYIKEAKKRL